jgi:hypothetical protein
LTNTTLTLIVAVKLAETDIEARLAGQKGIGLFAKNDMTPISWMPAGNPLYEEQPLFAIDTHLMFVNNRVFQEKLRTLPQAVVHAFECIPATPTIIRSDLFDLFRVTCFGTSRSLSACYTIYSMTKPSCTPNIFFLTNPTGRGLALLLHDSVRAGEELCVTYTNSVACMTTADRQKYFSADGETDAFTCRCATCAAPDSIRELSDMRRCVMRYLHFLITGYDLSDVPVKVRRLKKDKARSALWRWHFKLYGDLAMAEKVGRLAKELIEFGLRREAMSRGP